MNCRLVLAILVGKISTLVIKTFSGGATTAPGLAALKIDPNLVRKLSKKNKLSSIIISGTNGKTTTARLTSEILSPKFKIVHNRAGSNLLRGIASTMIAQSSLLGVIKTNLAIWEVDEATVPEAISNLSPKIIVLLNLFRDQLDRYGEVDTVRAKWQKILSATKGATLVLNADDPGVSILAESNRGKVLFFGVEQEKLNLPAITNVADIRHCLKCGANLSYSALLSAHMGHYSCPQCNLTRPTPTIAAKKIRFKTDFTTSLKMSIDHSQLTIHYSLPGLYNVYNVLAATTIANLFKIDQSEIHKALKLFSAAFGRFQEIKLNGKKIIIFLIKNPAGTNEVIRTIVKSNITNLLVILNDNIADGRDVSWIWDTDWEILATKIKRVGVAGKRAWDLANRLKYAELKMSKKNVYENIYYSIQESLEKLNNKNTLLILPTYTALLEVQKALRKMGAIGKWQEQ